MQNKTKLFKTAICIITTLILIFGTIPCGAVLSDESNAPTFTNLVVFMKFSDEDEFINNTYADTTVRNILDNTYNKSCLLYTSPSPRDGATSRMPSSA